MDLKSLVRFFSDSKNLGEIYAIFDLAKNAKDMLVGNKNINLPPEEKPKGGIFRSGDEINWITHTIDLPAKDQEILYGLLEYHFGNLNNPRNLLVAGISFVQYNKWRTMVTELDVPHREVGTQKTIIEEVGIEGKESDDFRPKSRTTTKEGKLFDGEVKNTEKLIQRVLEIVRSENERERGYDKAIAYMRSLNIPMMPKEETLVWIDENFSVSKVSDWVKSTSEKIMGFYRSESFANGCTNLTGILSGWTQRIDADTSRR